MADYADFIKFKAGDLVRRIKDDHNGMQVGDTGTVVSPRYHGQDSIDLEKFGTGHAHYNLELAKEASPIREVVKRELVAGRFGIVEIRDTADFTKYGIQMGSHSTKQLRAAAKTLTEIADYLESTN